MQKYELPKHTLFSTIMFRITDHIFIWFAVASDFVEGLLWKTRTYYLRRADLNWKPFQRIKQHQPFITEDPTED
jgi:hypothetical protein